MATNQTLTLTAIFDSKQAIAGVRQLVGEVNKLEKAFASFSPRNQAGNPYANLLEGAQSAVNALNEVQQKLSAVTSASTAEVANDIKAWRNELVGFNSTAVQTQKILRELSKDTDKAVSGFSKLSKPITIKVNPLKIPKIDPIDLKVKVESKGSKSPADDSDLKRRREDLAARINRENDEIKKRVADQQKQARDKNANIRADRISKGQKILDELQGRAPDTSEQTGKKKKKSLTDESIDTGKRGRGFVTREQNEQIRKNIERKQDNLRNVQANFQNLRRNAEERQEIQKEQRERAQKRIQERADEIKAEREQRKKELQARIRELENTKRERDREQQRINEAERQQRKVQDQRFYEARKRAESVKSTREGSFGSSSFGSTGRRTATTFSQDRVTLGYGFNNLSRTPVNTISPFRSVGGVGLDIIERRSPAGIQDTLQGAQEIMSAFGATGLAASGLALAISGGLVAAITGAIAVVNEFGKQFDYAIKDQLAGLGLSSEAQRVFGVSQQMGDSFYERLQRETEIAGMNTSVASEDITKLNAIGLPGLLRAYSESGRSLDNVSDDLVKQSTKFAILSQATPGVTPFQVQNAYTSAVSGNLGTAIKRQEFFRNSGLGDIVQQVADESGINLSRASSADQIDVLNKALERRVPKSLVDRLQKDSVEAQLSATYDYFFAPRTGVFGVLRDVDANVEGRQSLFDEFTRSVDLIIGADGFIAELVGIFTDLVPGGDTMKDLRDGLRGFNNVLEWFAGQFREIRDLVKAITDNPLIKAIDESVPRMNEGIIGIGKNGLESDFLGRQKERAGNFFSGIGNWFGSLFGMGRSGFTGHIPKGYSAASGFMPLHAAISSELANKPRNSNLVIANDTEFIFTQQQMRDLVNVNARPAYAGNSRMINIAEGAIVVNSPNTSPAIVADEVLARLNAMVAFEMDSEL
ncbi:MAG: hypothetical protein ACRDBG_25905 [Waterburya sp.]